MSLRTGNQVSDENFLAAHVLAIQDLGVSDEEWEAFARGASKKRSMRYRQKGSDAQMDNGAMRHRHGVANFNWQLIGIGVPGVHLLNMYAPPG